MTNETNDPFEEADEIQTFNDYMPKKLKIGLPHPDALVQSTSMAAVDLPDITYQLELREKVSYHV